MSAMTMWIFANHTVPPPQENKKKAIHIKGTMQITKGSTSKTKQCDMNMTSQFLTLNRLQIENTFLQSLLTKFVM